MSLHQQNHPRNGYHAAWINKAGGCKRGPARTTEACHETKDGIHRDGGKCRSCSHHHCRMCRRCIRCERNRAAKGLEES